MLNNAKAAQLNTDKTQMYEERQKTLTLLPASALCHSPSATLELLLKFSSAKNNVFLSSTVPQPYATYEIHINITNLKQKSEITITDATATSLP